MNIATLTIVTCVIGAAIEADKEGLRVGLQIMIPLVFSEHEVDYIIAIINRVRRELCRMEGVHEGSLFLQIGSMLETPRACLRADRITSIDEVEFLSFGSNDLTQMMLGLSRDDTQQFMVRIALAPLAVNSKQTKMKIVLPFIATLLEAQYYCL